MTVAILPWGDLFVDWLDELGVSLEEFRDEFTGSWMFGYARALREAGAACVIVGVTERIRRHRRDLHGPTGTPIHLLPPASPFRLVRPALLPGSLAGRRNPIGVARAALTHVSPYLATPPLALARVLRGEGCTAILSQEYETPRFDVCTAVGRVLGIPVFGTFQGGDYHTSRLEPLVRPLSLRAAAGFVVGTKTEETRLRARYGVPQRKLRRIFNPVDTEFWRAEDRSAARAQEGLEAGAELVAWHGQVHPRKGLDVLLDAWARVCSERPRRSLELLLIGGRRGSDELRADAARRGLRGVRILDDWILDPARLRRLLSAADVYAFPSRHEGFPVAPLEAMACGLPVVATDAQGLPDILEGGDAAGGILVRREDPAAFAAALGSLLDDRSRREALSRNARRRVETAFALDRVGAELAEFLGGPR